MSDIEMIASVHLGKAGDGTIVSPYISPRKVDPSFLVAVPRELNRVQYDITSSDFQGWDIWNAYEFSMLTANNFPINLVLKIWYSSDSPNIVESKSLKLYLNSYNFDQASGDPSTVLKSITRRISDDLSSLVESEVFVRIVDTRYDNYQYFERFNSLDEWDSTTSYETECENPSLLQHTKGFTYRWLHTNSLRSNCRVTHQPDWADVFIYIDSANVNVDSIKQYIVSFRNENHFHEECCEMIYKRLNDFYNPDELLVACFYTRRGGIDINPIRATSKYFLKQFLNDLHIDSNREFPKTMRQ